MAKASCAGPVRSPAKLIKEPYSIHVGTLDHLSKSQKGIKKAYPNIGLRIQFQRELGYDSLIDVSRQLVFSGLPTEKSGNSRSY